MVKSIIKNCILHLIICTLAITTIMTFIPAVNKKVTAKAAATNTDAEHVDFEYVPGALEWAGSQSRTGIAIYIVNTGTGMRVREPVVLLWGDDHDWIGEINAGNGSGMSAMSSELRRGSVASLANYKFVNGTELKNMPCPVSGDGNTWSSRSNYMKNWMDGASKADKKLTNAAYIAKKLFDIETFKNLKVGSGDNGDSKWKMIFETVSAHAEYGIRNGKDIVQSYTDHYGKKYPVKKIRTAYAWCKTYKCDGIDITQRYGTKGTANSKWMQSVLKSYGVLNDYAISINRITPTSGPVPASQGASEGWATGVANQLEIPIETSTTGGSPSEIETPNESIGTNLITIIIGSPFPSPS
ncbi:MAG: hypothetical protein K6G64_02900 [Eubacterium sp.]|nr:hypothetical protein [Eubacterium sp.]